MFSYFGSKSRLVKLYPKPSYDLIIEPFCGSARYACRYFHKDVWINDKYEVVYKVWKWIQQASPGDVRALPNKLPKGLDLRECDQFSQEEKLLLGFVIGQAGASPHNIVSSWGTRKKHFRQLKVNLLRIASKIDHWKITNLDYKEIPNQEATWFIDPPYQHMGRYVHNKIDFADLREWCLSRKGQIIVCEGTGADWLPFSKLASSVIRVKGTKNNSKSTYQELVYLRNDKKEGFGLV